MSCTVYMTINLHLLLQVNGVDALSGAPMIPSTQPICKWWASPEAVQRLWNQFLMHFIHGHNQHMRFLWLGWGGANDSNVPLPMVFSPQKLIKIHSEYGQMDTNLSFISLNVERLKSPNLKEKSGFVLKVNKDRYSSVTGDRSTGRKLRNQKVMA